MSDRSLHRHQVATKSAGSITNRRGSLPTGRCHVRGHMMAQPITLEKTNGGRSSGPGEAILPPGGSISDAFATRLAAWLADVAMNHQGAS